MSGQIWVEPIGKIIIARVRGIPTESLLRELQERILLLVKDSDQRHVLYDALEMEAPSVEVPVLQQKLNAELAHMKLRRAIVVPNAKLAYLARLAFGDEDYRVFYSDLAGAISWLDH